MSREPGNFGKVGKIFKFISVTFLQAIERSVNIVSYTILSCHSTELLVMMPHHHHPARLQCWTRLLFISMIKEKFHRIGVDTMLGEYWQLTRTNILPFTHQSYWFPLDWSILITFFVYEKRRRRRIYNLEIRITASIFHSASINTLTQILLFLSHVLIHRKGFSYFSSILAQHKQPQPKEIFTGPFLSSF